MSRHQIFAQQQVVIDSEEIAVSGADDLSFTYNEKRVLTSVDDNTSVGDGALANLTTGDDNIGIGENAGSAYVSTESGNIVIGNAGTVGDQATIRIGTAQTLCFIAGIHGVTSAAASAAVINSDGKLGTVVSTRKRKREIEDISPKDVEKLLKLNPKRFKMNDDPSDELHYGLIAEEVDEVMSELVVKDDKGQPATVQYQKMDGLQLAALKQLQASVLSLQTQFNDFKALLPK